ncbi:MAG TPA: class I SAM-dependent methyltransferase, partial [Actinomycetota bacterium]|nr:class I SAM-dependent methyltransferase [Actinomycetota bacterium]
VSELVEQIRAFSNVARDRFKGGSVDVLFIDGPHVYGAVVEDISDWTSTLKEGSVVAFNDAFWIEGVRRAIRDTVTRRRSPFRNPRWSFNTLFFDFRPSARWTARDLIGLARARAFLMLGGGWTELRGKAAKRSGVMPTTNDRSFKLMMATLTAVLPKATARR